ncbi:MAG: TPM domain-containing protein [Candidatus Caenarcaniphilales bacterium]|nr:TPM domain-containing protein [Candidatus Caenarcaniphilales bacterium]
MKNRNEFLSPTEQDLLAKKIDEIESVTDAELRIHIESYCKVDPMSRAAKVFKDLKMYKTKERNGVLFYIAIEDHKLAVWGDEAIHKDLGQSFWDEEIEILLNHFKKQEFYQGLVKALDNVKAKLEELYPFTGHKNELSNEISFGQ